MTEEDVIKMQVTKGVKKIGALNIGRGTGMFGVAYGLKAVSWIWGVVKGNMVPMFRFLS